MGSEIWAGPLGEWRAVSTADGGTALSTTVAYIPLLINTSHIQLTPRNYSTAVVAQVLRNPYLIILKTVDNLVTATDFSEVAQDADAASEVNLDAMGIATSGDYLYVGSHLPFAGVYVDVSADSGEANGTASTLSVYYWNGSAWVDISATDNTISSSASIGTDGTVTWTVPTGWKSASLERIGSPVAGTAVPWRDIPLYWTRWQWDTALDAVVRIDAMLAINRSTAYAELIQGQAYEERIIWGPGGIGCLQAKANAGTANLVVNAATRHDARFR